jgi:hypothetical protein
MDSDDKAASRPAKADKPAPTQDGVGAAFDLWLQRSLHQLYDGVAAEPIPPDLLRLIETDRARRGN